MKRKLFLQALNVGMLICAMTACNTSPQLPEPRSLRLFTAFRQDLDRLDSSLTRLESTIQKSDSNRAGTVQVQSAFEAARHRYKSLEALLETFEPDVALEMNAAALDKVEDDDPNQNVIPPTGFQAMEEFLYPNLQASQRLHLIGEVGIMRSAIVRARQSVMHEQLTDENVFDALRAEIFRIITLGISGFDSPVALTSLPEAATALRSLNTVLAFYDDDLAAVSPLLMKRLKASVHAAITYTEAKGLTFDTFDRLTFISEYVNPISLLLHESRVALKIPFNDYAKPLASRAKTLFDAGAFNASAYAPHRQKKIPQSQAELGRLLFFDPVLSEKNNRACASCHQPQRGFTDGLAHALTASHDRTKLRNTPTLINAGFQQSSSYDQSTTFLEDRVMKVLQSSDEMHTSLTEVAAKLRRSDDYAARFQKTFGVMNAGMNRATKGEQITEENVKVALAMYVRSLQSFNSRFDQYMRGDTAKLSTSERHGFNLFMGKAKCGTCHFMPLFNGTVPPVFTDSEAEVIGVPAKADTANAEIDSDVGKYALHQIALEKFMFKTPSVRNIALTAPYMHNGVYKTLNEVMDFYNRGGGWGISIDLPNQTLPAEKLNLSQPEIKDVIAFMHALTDTTGLTAKPISLPRFNDSALNTRKIGGVY